MAKTIFKHPPRTVLGNHITADFLNTIYKIGGGHKHDGGSNDGSAGKIDPLSHIDPTPSSAQELLAGDTITVNATHLRIKGSGGAVTLSSNPQIATGNDGQVIIIEGTDDTNTVTIVNGNGVQLHGGKFLMFRHDYIALAYSSANNQWEEIYRNAPSSEKSWAFKSPTGSTGSFYAGGFYSFGASNNDFSPAINVGSANASYAAHFFVVLGEVAVDEITIKITGTTINDQGVRTALNTATITIPNASTADTYFETNEKWIGQIAVETTAGTAKNCNYGLAKYWDNSNNDFRITGIEAIWLGGANDAAPDILLRHHKATGWTYNAGSTPTPPIALASMQGDHATEIQVKNNEEGAWKRDNLSTFIEGSGDEGTIIETINSVNKAFELGTVLLRIRQA